MSNEISGYELPKTENFKFFSHRQCEYFPCHQLKGGMAEEDFNCLFCYCPLYALGPDCGGNFSYTESGVKDCTRCTLPHRRDNYGYITSKFQEIARRMAESRRRGV